jgi:Tfp pilus assembly protein PilO
MQIDRPISIAIILFISLLLIFFLVVPKYNNLKNLELDLAQKKAEFNAQFDYYSEITAKYHELQTRSEDLQKINDALPASANFGQLSYYFQKQAKDNGLILKSISLSQNASANGIKDVVFSLNLSGDYLSLENFIIGLEKSARLFEISNISFGLSVGSVVQEKSTEQETVTEQKTQFSSQQIFNFSLEVKTHSY